MFLKKLIKIIRNAFCAVGLIFISPFLLLAACMIAIEDGVPIFFIQQRLGKNQKIFKIIKIRTLKKDTPQTGTHQLDQQFKLVSGNIIRKTKLDEFPQLINVLRGEINLVGPRPGLPNQVELANARLSKNVFKIKPGITGLAQVLGHDMSNPQKLAEIDKIYIDNRSFKINLLILIGTFVKYPRPYLGKLIIK